MVLSPDPPATVPKDTPEVVAWVFRDRNGRHKRVAGARLTVAARWVKDWAVERAIRVDWAIDYRGPRRPFTIATPGQGTNGVTAHFWYVKPDGMSDSFTSGWGGGRDWLQEDTDPGMFSVAAGGDVLAGRLDLKMSRLPERHARVLRPGSPPLWVQLEYAPANRGDGEHVARDPAVGRGKLDLAWTFDAWTGRLLSPVVKVEVE